MSNRNDHPSYSIEFLYLSICISTFNNSIEKPIPFALRWITSKDEYVKLSAAAILQKQ